MWSHVKFEEQTLTSGQQPHSPDCSLQQVVPEAQLLLSSHLTSVTAPGSVRALSLVNQGTTWGPFEQEERWGSQVWPLGQQWFPSLQQTAWGTAKVTLDSLKLIISFVSVWDCFNNHWPLAEDSSPICGSCSWSSRSYLWGSWFGRRTWSWPAELDWKQPDWTPSAGPLSSAARAGWAGRACHKSAQPRYICILWGSSARDRYSTRPGKNKIERLFNASWNPWKCQIFSSTDV